ncbi:unnamed protein product [Ceutorhynchus assimilis]|uniref:AAA+ ATPase domain-containing protein n=1 Tax=Ceutorhynchus assimilis TaxID=467358 RepID=A0A9N9QHR8_9CUCU|nr:unnamed protein product [Ceutorhynchus assimilis]
MEKLPNSSSVEIVPLSDSSVDKSQSRIKSPYISDATLVPRVQKYLESNVDQTYVDINHMSDQLQKKYREYAKRKRSAFRASVKKAYSIVLQSYGMQEKDSSEEDISSNDSDDVSDGMDNVDENSMNNALVNLYQRPQPSKMIESELIDISSEDSDEEAAYNYRKSNGAAATASSAPRSVIMQGIYNNKPPQVDIVPVNHTIPKKRKHETATISPITLRPKKQKTTQAKSFYQEPRFSFKHIGGMDKTLEDVCKLLLHIKHPELYSKLGISPPRGFLLHGPPGCGKTLLANAIAGELGVHIIKVAAPELVAGVSGESEERIRELFERACDTAPCVLFIDEVDSITPNRQNAQKEMERRIVAQLLSCLDDLSENGQQVLVIGATNRPDGIDPALRRAGRFDREICLGIPDVKAREEILRVLSAHLTLASDFDYGKIAKFTPGYVGADLLSLAREAAMVAVNRVFNTIKEQRKLKPAIQIPVKNNKNKNGLAPLNKKDDKPEEKEEEIVVDDDVSKPEESTNKNNDATVVVLDDAEIDICKVGEVKPKETEVEKLAEDKPPTEKKSSDVNEPVIIIEVESQEPMPVDIKTLTTLEELQSWLHDTVPVSDHDLLNLCITMDDFQEALKKVQPSAKREGFATVPDTTWDDVGSLRDIREELQMAILAPVRHSEQFEALGLTVPAGVLLCGPPGCGKTLLAKAIANEAGINFISVKGPELLNMYVGESERAVRVCFERARNSAPCVIFFDELDALCPKRSDTREGGATMRVVNQMLTEMDGVEGRKGVFLLAASNRPDIIDPAVLRPGRLDKILYVGLPSREDRVDILKAITKNGDKPKLDEDVDLKSIGTSEQTKGYTGADLAALVREASVLALKEIMLAGDLSKPLAVSSRHFVKASEKIRPSVPEKDQKHYEKLKRMYTAVPDHAEVEEMEYS